MLIVSTTAATGSGSLREALAIAPDDTTILITASGSIQLDGSPLQCTRSITIQGIAADALSLDAQHIGRILEIAPAIHVRLQGITLCNGVAEQGGAILNAGTLALHDCVLHHNSAAAGGAIANFGTLHICDTVLHHNHSSDPQRGGGALFAADHSYTRISQSEIAHNQSAGYGGALLNSGELHLHDTHLHHNTANHSGGAIRHEAGTLELARCTLQHNQASAGGAIWQQPASSTIIRESLFERNRATRQPGSPWAHPNGGAIWNNGGTLDIHTSTFIANEAARNSGAIHSRDFHHPAHLTICNSTFAHNRAERSGGVLSNYGTADILTSTLVDNLACQQAGALINGARATLHLFGSILAGNQAATAATASGRLTSQGYNLFDSTGGYILKGDTSTNLIGNPQLGDLADNGGSTPTFIPLPTSPVLNVIPPTVRPIKTDQRGRPRPTTYGWCIGAVQVEPTDATLYHTHVVLSPYSPAALAAIAGAQAMPETLPRTIDFRSDNLAAELHQALEQHAFRLVYQPIVHIHSGQVFAYTALLRWEHAKWGMLMPDVILALASLCGMSRRVDRWVMREVVQQASQWQLAGVTPLLAFHVSPASLQDDDIVRELDMLFATHSVPSSQFLIEISAPLLPTDDELDNVATVLTGIQSLLCGVALDRVNGSTALATLRRLPMDVLLLDRTCVNDLHANLNAAPVIQTLVSFAHSQGINPVITGIEHTGQLEWVSALGSEYAQGYLYARPLPAESLQLNATYALLPAPEQRLADVLSGQSATAATASLAPPAAPNAGLQPYPATLSESDAVRIAYQREIEQAARYLDHNLSVLIVCDKALVERLAYHIVDHSTKSAVLADDPVTIDEDDAGSREALADLISKIKPDQVLVLHHLDLVVDNRPDWPLINTARTLVSLFYRKQRHPPTLLAFADPSLHIPPILRERFTVHLELGGINREKLPYLVTHAERMLFERFDPAALFKHVADMHVVQFRTAMRYLAAQHTGTPAPSAQLFQELQPFRRDTHTRIEIPDVSFDEIGGYADVKQQVFEAIELITGRPVPYNADGTPLSSAERARSADLPTETPDERDLRRKLAPRGLIFYGPPGTGKTLFAKAIANVMQATFQLVSGPEIMSKWIGESESNLRQIFATARRNAPAVILFDEFDSIAGKRSGFTDSGSREMNAVVSQLLTELDGFQGEQEILVIGTTNRLEMIDKALLRPSRLQPIAIGLPDRTARRQIAAIHLRTFKVELPAEELLDVLAEHTEGFSGDEVRSVIQGVARRARRGEPVDRETFYTQLARVQRYHRDHHRLRLDNEDMVH